MKKSAEKKAHKRDSGEPQGSPRLPQGASFNGEIVDASQVSVSVVRSQSRSSHVDVVSLDLKQVNLLSQHRRTASYPENGFLPQDDTDASQNTASGDQKASITPASHAREAALNGGNNSSGSNGSLTTHL